MAELTMDKLVTLCKGRGFVFPSSEIYGGIANVWDYGPLGVELKNNIKREWWRYFVQESENSVGLDGAIFLNPKVWVASGHVGGFSDPKMDCKNCKTRHRADHILEKSTVKLAKSPDAMTDDEMQKIIADNQLKCPNCGKFDWTPVRQFNMMFKTYRGVLDTAKKEQTLTEEASDESTSLVFLRPETAQSQFVNFLNVQRSMRLKIPFGIGQIGKAFRNEITPGNFTFRTIECEQMEHQLFCHKNEAQKYYDFYKQHFMKFLTQTLGIKPENTRFKDHEKLSHYAKAACDIEYKFAFGWGELNGTHHRSEFDLTQHTKASGKNMEYTDPITNEKYVPTVIECTVGADRLALTVLTDAYHEDTVDGETRVVLRLKPSLAPYKAAILPLQKKGLTEKAEELYRTLQKQFMTTYDDAGSIGKRYRRQDEIGTPFCITVDYDTLTDNSVTIRERDTMKQTRIKIEEVETFIKKSL